MVRRYQPKDLFAVVMDAKTGEILAFSQRPTFNPETGEDFGKNGRMIYIKIRMNQVLLFKSFGLAAAIQEGKFNPKKNMSLDIVISWVLEFPTGIKLVGAKFQCH